MFMQRIKRKQNRRSWKTSRLRRKSKQNQKRRREIIPESEGGEEKMKQNVKRRSVNKSELENGTLDYIPVHQN
jgi:hypothetical protein